MKRILDYSPMLDTELQNFIKAAGNELGRQSRWATDYFARLQDFAVGGKILRGSTVCFSCAAFSGKSPDKAAINTALALELAHSSLLMHDDVIDKDEIRRGRPSVYRQYDLLAKAHKLPAGADFGANMAICGGDAGLFLAMELLGRACKSIDSTKAAELHRLFSDCMFLTCMGQMQDIYLQARSSRPLKSEIYSLMRHKTAAYTLELPLAVGAVLTGQSAETVKNLRTIGSAAGTIFQIRDDQLGILATQDTLGKPIGSDIKEGKKTLVYYFLIKACDKTDNAWLSRVYGNPDISLKEIKGVQTLVRKYRINDLLEQEIRALQAKASNLINNLPLQAVDKQELKSLVAFCAHRQA